MPVLTLPGHRLVEFCVPIDVAPGLAITAFVVSDNLLAHIGVLAGTVLVCRMLRFNERPPDGSVCVVEYQDRRFAKAVSFGVRTVTLADSAGQSPPLATNSLSFGSVALYACSCQKTGTLCQPQQLLEVDEQAVKPASELLKFVADPEGRMLYISPEYMRMIGMEPTEFDKWHTPIHPHDKHITLRKWRHALATESFFINTGRVLTAEGYRWITALARPVRDSSGKVIRWDGYLQTEALAEMSA